MSKRYNAAIKLVDLNKTYSVEEAVKLARETSKVKFDATVEAHLRLNVDSKQSDQKVRTQVQLPHGTGKKLRIAAFVSTAREKEAREAGADIFGGEELIKKIKDTGKTDFDIAVAESSMMKSLAGVAKILGQKGLMPNPKAGTVGDDVAKMISELAGGKVDVRADDTGIIHQAIGKVSFDDVKLIENFNVLRDAIVRAKPASVKKDFVASITITTSMGPGIKVIK